MLRLVLAATLLFALPAHAVTPWPAEVRSALQSLCEYHLSDAPAGFCPCLVNELERLHPDFDPDVLPSDEEVKAATSLCLAPPKGMLKI
jgi:hypothetical protein